MFQETLKTFAINLKITKIIFKKAFGLSVMKTKIKYLRQEMGITQKELAEKVGVSRQTINALENGKYNPSLVVAYKITQLLNKQHIEEVFIFEDEEE